MPILVPLITGAVLGWVTNFPKTFFGLYVLNVTVFWAATGISVFPFYVTSIPVGAVLTGACIGALLKLGYMYARNYR